MFTRPVATYGSATAVSLKNAQAISIPCERSNVTASMHGDRRRRWIVAKLVSRKVVSAP